jgi:hypothetical protein
MVLSIQLLTFYVAWGLIFTKYIPDLNWALKFFLDILQTTAFWPTTLLPLTILLPYIALLTARAFKLTVSLKTLGCRSISAR